MVKIGEQAFEAVLAKLVEPSCGRASPLRSRR
jgi:hypothetical protein